MLMKIDYLQIRGGRLRYRRRIPEDIRPFFGGKVQIVQALGLKVGQEARAIELIRVIDRDVSRQFLQAKKAAQRNEDPAVLAQLAEEWALANKYLGVDRSGLEPVDGDYGPSDYDLWLDRVRHEVESKAGRSHDVELTDFDPLDQYRIETVKAGKRVSAPLTIETAIETYTAIRHDGELPKAEEAAFKQLRGWIAKKPVKTLPDVSRSLSQEFLTYLASVRQQKSGTIRRRLNSLRALWSFSIDHYEMTAQNPWARLQVPKVAEQRPAEERLPFNASHWAKIDAYLTSAQGDVRDILLLLKVTGCRPLEISGLAADDVIEIAGRTCLRIRRNDFRRLKNAESVRIIPVTEAQACAVLTARSGYGGALFPESLHGTSNLSQRLNGALRKAGVPKSSRLTAYSFRHSLTEALRLANVPDHHLKAVLGHADPTTTSRYGAGSVDMAALAESLEAAQRQLGKVPLHIYKHDELISGDEETIEQAPS